MHRSEQSVSNALKKEIGDTLYAFHTGRNRVILAKNLAAKLNQSEVIVRRAIAEMRIAGKPIASTNRAPMGYYIPATIDEAKECLEHLRSRVRKISMSAAGVEKGLYAMFRSQLDLPMVILNDPTKPIIDERVRPPEGAFIQKMGAA